MYATADASAIQRRLRKAVQQRQVGDFFCHDVKVTSNTEPMQLATTLPEQPETTAQQVHRVEQLFLQKFHEKYNLSARGMLSSFSFELNE